VEGIRSTNISMITKKRKDLIIATNINMIINMIIVTGKNILLMILLLKMNF